MAYELSKIKIMIVDDMKPMLDLTKSILNAYGFQRIQLAEHAKQAFEMVCIDQPDIILTDWLMPEMDGLELARMIRTSERVKNPYVPIIMMTGFSARFRVEQARDAGITEFLVKPFTSGDLCARLEHIIEKPRQFVEAGSFFGPDRRRKRPKDYQGPRRRDTDIDIEEENKNEAAQDILKKLRDEARNI